MSPGNGEEKVFRVLDLIAQSPRISQRDVAMQTGLSLGLVNLAIKRLLETGYIKVLNLDRRKVSYILTSKGMLEKSRRTYRYVCETVKTFQDYKARLDRTISDLVKEKKHDFAVLGEGEIASLVLMSLGSMSPPPRFRRLRPGQKSRPGELVLDCRLKRETKSVGVSVLSQLLE